MIPIIPMIALVGIFVQYWIEKYLLLRRHKVPDSMGSAMAKFYASMVPLGMLLYAIGNYVFEQKLSDNKNTHGQYALWVMIAYYVFPIGFIINTFTLNVKRDNNLKYEKVRFQFVQDYDRSNPMTENTAKAKYFRELRESAEDGNEEDKKRIDEELGNIQNQGKFGTLFKYGQQHKGLESKGGLLKLKGADKKQAAGVGLNNQKNKAQNPYFQKLQKIKKKNADKSANPESVGLIGLGRFKKGQVVPQSGGDMNKDTLNDHNDSEIPLATKKFEEKKK